MEILDLYDVTGNKTDQTMVRGTKPPKGFYRRKITIGIFNDKEEMLIQKVSQERKYWTGMWTPSVSGSVSTGETSQLTASREAKEELGLNIDFSDIRPAFTINFSEGFDDFYLIKKEVKIEKLVLQKEEVAEVKWATKQQIIDMIKTGEFLPFHFEIIDLMFLLKDEQGSYRFKK
ncbi:NUDIX hydrolase [Mesoplasma tabanidae]|uniref:Nucleoside diphosphate hydrolase n=1 Tax=Mesoplasma tabanidae TaxID=219745 RepID=A0A2K8P4N5_9MOLU|nr:NUDIX domain-containing protein [Mesoplasma tabanidae]ATZ21712.1 nucleoside diphosphate hydrolase [Mesoplasma tabanidae]